MSSVPSSASELVGRVRHLISLPAAYLRVKTLVSDPEASLADLANAIAHDPAITARLLRLVNSAYFGYPPRVDTVSRAVGILGMRRVHDVVLASSVTQAFAGMDSRVMSMDVYWRRSVHCGVAAHLLAAGCRMLDPERVFVAGLLHDLGHLILYQEVPELAAAALQTYAQGGVELWAAERDLLGFDYAEVGGELLSQWGLPDSLVESVRFHTQPALATRHPLLASLVHIARCGIEAAEYRGAADPVPLVHPAAWTATGLEPEALAPALAEAQERVGAIVGLLLGR